MITFSLSEAADSAPLLALQALNHADRVGTAAEDGFVSLAHTPATLDQVRGPYRHIVARSGAALAGYALVMLEQQRALFPLLGSMFEVADAALDGQPYFVMGQVCVAQDYRGQGVFDGLYQAMRAQMRPHFPLIVTEVAHANQRSMRAHARVGFKPLGRQDADSPWQVIAWDWSAP